jgi:3-methyladenine DNA glycosylase AlkD
MTESGPLDVQRHAGEVARRVGALPARDVPHLRALRRELSREVRGWEPAAVLDLARELVGRGGWESRFLACELVASHGPALAAVGAAELEALGAGMADWGAVDTFGCYVAGPAWRERQVRDEVVHGWARSPDRWWRRAALVATVALNSRARGGRGDAARTLAVCRLLAGDRDDMVVKALSWALRELAKRDADAVRAFLAEHEGRLAPRVVREVTNKLTTGLKTPRRQSPGG